MENSVLFLDLVKVDLIDAKAFYKGKGNDLEYKFSLSIEKELNRIIATPQIYQIRYKNIRIAYPKIFPFNIHFYFNETENLIVITAIVHNKRNQDTFKNRL